MPNKRNYLQLIGLTKAYDNGYVVVKDININIDKGEFVTLLGPSGCGKTTILKMIAGFELPTNGQIKVDGIDIKELPVNQRPTATVFQDYALFPNMTVYQNITYGLKAMRKPLRNISPKVKNDGHKIYSNATKKAAGEIKNIQKQQMKLLREISKVENMYLIYQEVENIKNMRYAQFMMKSEYFLKKLHNALGNNTVLKISLKNRWLEFINRLSRKMFHTNKPVKYDVRRLDKWSNLYLELRKWYFFKQPFDNRIDKLTAHYNSLDQLASYWQNFPQTSRENYEKHYINRKLTKSEIKVKADEMVELVDLKGSENKYPSELSGGMQQRVALARALVVEPDILLLDEPLSALDAKVRQQMQLELKRLHNRLGLTFILVTHDQEEALTLSNKVVVMSKGRVEQIDSPKKIYDNPRSEWVASFIGKANLFNGKYQGNCKVEFNDEIFTVSDQAVRKFNRDTNVKFMIRPEDIRIVTPERGIIKVRITSTIYKGLLNEIHCQWKNHEILVETTLSAHVGQKVGLDWDANAVHVMLDKMKGNPNEFRF